MGYEKYGSKITSPKEHSVMRCQLCCHEHEEHNSFGDKTLDQISALEVFVTPYGISVICARHEKTISVIDLPENHFLLGAHGMCSCNDCVSRGKEDTFLTCKKCGDALKRGKFGNDVQGMHDITNLNVAITDTGISVYCVRHNADVISFDLPPEHPTLQLRCTCVECLEKRNKDLV